MTGQGHGLLASFYLSGRLSFLDDLQQTTYVRAWI
jgi:hypothetical protein